MGEVQDSIGKNGKGEDEPQSGANKGNKKKEESEVGRGVIRRLRRDDAGNERQPGEATTNLPDEELDVPNLEVPEDQ